MKILAFIQSLLPKFSSNTLTEDSRVVKTLIETSVIPSYNEAEKVFFKRTWVSKEAKNMQATFDRNVKGVGHGSLVTQIKTGLDKALNVEGQNSDMIERLFNDNVIRDGVTALMANVIRMNECLNFVAYYSQKLLAYLYIVETREHLGDPQYVKTSLIPVEVKYVEENYLAFCLILNSIIGSATDYKVKLAKVPDVLLTAENIDTISAVAGGKALDPTGVMSAGFSFNSFNPAYHYALFTARRVTVKYQAATEIKKSLEMRKLYLESVMDDAPDALVQKQIDSIQNRIDNYEREIREIDESLKD